MSGLARYFADIWEKYRCSPWMYRSLYWAQGGRCAICREAAGKTRRLAVDHNHALKGQGAVRGLLCSGSLSANTCNRLIAHYSVEQLERAAAYLRNPPALRAWPHLPAEAFEQGAEPPASWEWDQAMAVETQMTR